ncbi:unnamed protein product [Amaranthus hypochondriacus]
MSVLWIFLFFIFLISTEVIARQKSEFYSPIQMNIVKSSNSGTLSKSGNQQHNILQIGNRRILTCSNPQGCCAQGLCGSPPYGPSGYYPGYGGGGYPGYGGGGYPGYGGGGYPYPPKSVDEKKKKHLEKKAKQVEEVHN